MPVLVDVSVPADQAEGTRSQVLRWLKSPGERVAENEPLIELETDKVTVEIPAPATGVLREILKHEQDEVEPGERLGRIEVPADAGARIEAASDVRSGQADPSRGATPSGSTPFAPRAAPTGSAAPRAGAAIADSASSSVVANLSPAVRRLLAEHRVDDGSVRGTGAGGRITADDVLGYVAARGAPGSDVPPTSPSAASESSAVDASMVVAGMPAARRVPHTAMRRRIAERMVHSLLQTAPHVTTVFEADLAGVLAHRERNRAAYAAVGAPLTLTAYLVAACVDAIREVPEANARWTEDALELYDRIDIGVGTALPYGGLVVPVIRDVAALDLGGIALQLGDLTTRAREDRLTPADVRGGTFTISNHGVSGSLIAAPIVINQPQSAILGVGRVEKRAVVVARDGVDVVEVRPRCYVTLTIDHRVMDGQRANRFLEVLVARLEHWAD